VTFTEPEVAHVGLTEAAGVAEHGDRSRVDRLRTRSRPRAHAGETDGFVKLIAVPGRSAGMALGKLVGHDGRRPDGGRADRRGALAMRAARWSAGSRRRSTPIRPGRCRPAMAAARFFGDSHGGRPAREGAR
jgi:hypothetical protein